MQHVALSDDGATLVIGSEHQLIALEFPSCAPRWRYQTQRTITQVCMLGDGRIAAGCADGALLVIG